MPNDFDPENVDPSVTAEDVERARDATPADFPDVEDQDTLDDASPALRGLVGVVPATPGQAAVNAKRLRDDHVNLGVGMCLAAVRGPIFGLPALWPDANTAIDHGAPVHRTSNPLDIPRGTAVVWRNDRHGHIAFGLGGGLCSTTDYHEPGFEGVALISKLAPWCGGTLVGWIETVNGFDVWPDPKKPPHPHQPDDPKPAKPWTLEQRAAFVHRRAQIAKHNHHDRAAKELNRWYERMQVRIKAHGG